MVVEEVFTLRALADRYVHVHKVDFDASYPTGGEALTVAELGFSVKPDVVLVFPRLGHVFEYDMANEKLLAYWGDNNNAADGPLVEVPNTTNLSALVDVIVLSIGAFAR